MLRALREQALRTRVMVLEDAIRQFVRGNETMAQLRWRWTTGWASGSTGEHRMSDRWFSNPRLEMAADDYAPEPDDLRGQFEADRALDEVAQEDSLYSDEIDGTRLRRKGEDDD
jgi:hypothetical protein